MNGELKYVDKLNIGVTTINDVKNIIKQHILNVCTSWSKGFMVEKNTYHIIGPAGVGKTQICFQIAQELTQLLNIPFEVIKLHAPVLSRDDFLIPYPVNENKFKMLISDFIPSKPKSFGILIIDEFSRADHSLQQLFWQIQNEYMIHTHSIPPGWFVVATDNPDDQEYSMNNMEDAAGLRRMIHLYVDVNAKEFLEHAIKSNFHPFVIEFIQTYPSYIYDYESQKRGNVYANPGSYEKLSNELWAMEHSLDGNRDDLVKNINKLEQVIYGLLNVNMGQIFIEVISGKRETINPEHIISNFESVREKIQKHVDEKNNTFLHEMIQSVITYLSSVRPEINQTTIDNFVKFITILPVEMAAVFIHNLGIMNKMSEEYKYLSKLSQKCAIANEEYKKLFVSQIKSLI